MGKAIDLLSFSAGVAALLGACGATGGSGGIFSISAESAVYMDGIGIVKPANGRVFVDVAITIANTSEAAPVTATPSFFSLELASSVRVTGNPAYSMLLSKPCTQDLSVAAGGSLACHVVFEAPMNDAPTKLFYTDEKARTASTNVPTVKWPPCDPPKGGDPAGGAFLSDDGIGYLVRLPDGYEPSQPRPLLVAYSPAGADAALNERFTGLTPDATERGYIVVYVDNVSPTGLDVVQMAANVVPAVTGQWCVDPKRIYLTGHSNGGSVTEVVSAKGWVTVAAAAPSAAGANVTVMQQLGCPSRPLPELEIHSAGDQLFPLTEGFGADVAAWWAQCDKCDATPSDPDDDNCITYSKCAAGVEVVYCEGTAQHGVWPRLNTRMLDFFDRFRAP